MHPRKRRTQSPTFDPAADVPHLAPHFTMLGPDDCQRLHEASCRILERTGVRVYHAGALQLLKQAGACIEDDLAKIPAELVEDALATAPHTFNLYNRGGNQVACVLDGTQISTLALARIPCVTSTPCSG